MDTNTLVPSLIVALGVLGGGYAWYSRSRALESRNWPTTSGRIVSAELEQHSASGGATFRAHVTYTYEVAGKAYSGSRAAFGDRVSTSSRGIAERRVAAYTRGSLVTVYYDPAAPEKSVLQAGPSADINLTFLLSALFVAVGVIVLLFPGS